MLADAWGSFVPAALSGVCIGLIGVAYRLGQPRGLSPLDVLGACCVLGAAAYGVAFWSNGGHLADVPLSLWAWAIAAGLGQYVSVKLFGAALRIGPLAPAWCVVSLNFVPTMIYAAVFLSEKLVPVQYAAVVASVLCVVVASIRPGTVQGKPAQEARTCGNAGMPRKRVGGEGTGDAEQGTAGGGTEVACGTLAEAVDEGQSRSGGRLGRQVVYMGILGTIFVVGSLLSIAIRGVGAHRPILGETAYWQQSHFLLLMCYVVLLVCAFVDMWVGGRLAARPGMLAGLGTLAGIGSVGGLALLTCCSTSGMSFAIAGIAQILFVAVISVVAFGEKPTANWYGTIGLGVLAVTLANWG